MSEIAVLGAGGPTGKQCVEKLLAQNKKVVAVVRDPAKYLGVWSSSKDLRIESGDVTNVASLAKALSSVKGVIFAASGKTYFSASSVDTEVRPSFITNGIKTSAQFHIYLHYMWEVNPHRARLRQ